MFIKFEVLIKIQLIISAVFIVFEGKFLPASKTSIPKIAPFESKSIFIESFRIKI